MSQETKPMMLISSEWMQIKTFRLLPMTPDCPFMEGIYDPNGKVLVLISKEKKQSFHMVARLNEDGDPIVPKKPRQNNARFAEERRLADTYQEYYVTEETEIEEIIDRLASNSGTFDYKKYTKNSTIMVPETTPALILPDDMKG